MSFDPSSISNEAYLPAFDSVSKHTVLGIRYGAAEMVTSGDELG